MRGKGCQTKKVSLLGGFKGQPAQNVIAGQAVHDAGLLRYNERNTIC
jgi:hypothetical protein